jgi:hypothetical protein
LWYQEAFNVRVAISARVAAQSGLPKVAKAFSVGE